MRSTIIIYTDGSCLLTKGGAGGWAAILRNGPEVTEIAGGEMGTTNNRMELLAAIKALQHLPVSCDVFLYTDSRYVQYGATMWLEGWKRKGWLTKEGKTVLNQDLWVLLDTEAARHVISWRHVKGHTGDVYNERCDELATNEARLQCNPLQTTQSLTNLNDYSTIH